MAANALLPGPSPPTGEGTMLPPQDEEVKPVLLFLLFVAVLVQGDEIDRLHQEGGEAAVQ